MHSPYQVWRHSIHLRGWLFDETDQEGLAKRQAHTASVNAVSGQNGFLLHVLDESQDKKWLVNGGAFVSLIPPTSQQRLQSPDNTKLQAANGSPIASFGSASRTPKIGNQSFTFNFVVADVKHNLRIGFSC